MKTTYRRTIFSLLIIAGLLVASIAAGFGSRPVTAAVFPSVTSITGSRWSYTCPSTFNNFLQVPYAGRSDSGAAPITLKGTNLNTVSAVSIGASGYSVSIKSKSSTQLVLDVRASQPSESPKPVYAPSLYLIHSSGVLVIPITPGLMPTMYVNNLSWGQCTWWAGGIRRIQTGRPVVAAYSLGAYLNPNPGNAGFPRTGSVLMTYQRHMSFVESMSESGRINYSDGSTRITYQINVSQYNWPCGAEKTQKSTTMIILRSRSGTYSFITRPVVGYEIDRIAQ